MEDEQEQRHEQEHDCDHDQGQQEEQDGQDEMMKVTPSRVAGPSRAPSQQQAPTSEAAPHLSDNVPKRQRRPNVRLNEIGDISVEYLLDRKASPTGKPSRKPSLSPKFHVNDVDDDVDVVDERLPAPLELSKKRNPLPSNTASKQLRLDRHHRPRLSATRQAAHPLRHEGNGDISLHKAMPGNTDGLPQVAHGSVSGCSDTEKHVKLSSHKDFDVRQRGSSFKKSLKKTQSSKIKKMVSGKRAPVQVHAFKLEVQEKEEPLSSNVQELCVQGPVWEKGVVPLDGQVQDWIRGIGFEKYASLFQHHEVVNDCLPLLTMDDLKEMGIVAVGARRKLFNEILKLNQGFDARG